MLTLLLCLSERAPSWLEKVFCRAMGSNEPCVEEDALDVGGNIVATAISSVLDRFDLDRSLPLEKRVGTSVLSTEVIRWSIGRRVCED